MTRMRSLYVVADCIHGGISVVVVQVKAISAMSITMFDNIPCCGIALKLNLFYPPALRTHLRTAS